MAATPDRDFRDLRDFRNSDLVLPINGKDYVIPSPSADEVIRLRLIFNDPQSQVSGKDYVDELAAVLGGKWDEDTRKYVGGLWSEMQDDGVSGDEIWLAGETALMRFGLGRVQAQIFWEQEASNGEGGEDAPKGNRATRRATAKRKPTK